MKPDTNNPGSVESVQRVDNINYKNNKNDNSNIRQAETQANSISPPPTVKNQNSDLKTIANTNSASPANTPPAKEENLYEKQIAQLPAEESDIIEKDWVEKVDEIVEKTASDPYFEEQAHHALSKAYLKKRFNLDVQ